MSQLLDASPLAERENLNQEQLAEEIHLLEANRSAKRLSRRRAITNLSLAAGAAGVLGMSGCSNAGSVAVSSATTTPSVLEVLNFALNLEYLEATFYSVVMTGSGLPASLMGSGAGNAQGGAKVSFANSFVANIAANLMTEEVQHVAFLRTTIAAVGGSPVPMPELQLVPSSAFTVNNDATFLAVARQLEGVGVSAYIGGAGYLASSAAALTYAAQILDTEAQHEGCLRQACIQLGVTSPPADSLDMPPVPPSPGSQLFNTGNSTGLNPVRNVSQVLQIVYGTPGQTGVRFGGFFPAGLNGDLYIS